MRNKTKIIFSSIFPSPSNSQNAKIFFKEVFKDIYKRSGRMIDMYTFHEITQLPMLISEKIFYAINTSHNKTLSISDFTLGMCDIYYGKLESKTEFLFNLLDFDKDKYLEISDVKLFFSYFHMMVLQSTNEYMIDEIIEEFFQSNGNGRMDYSDFCTKVLSNHNYDLVYLFIIFMKKFSFFTNAQINYCAKNSELSPKSQYAGTMISNVSSVNFDNLHFHPPGNKCFDYAYLILTTEAPSESPISIKEHSPNNELNELDSFENDIGGILDDYDDSVKRSTSINNGINKQELLESRTVDDINDDEDGKFEYNKKLSNFFFLRRTKKEPGENTPSQLNSVLASPTTNQNAINFTSSATNAIEFFQMNNFSEFQLYSLKKFYKMVKVKIVLVDNCIFYFKYNPDSHFFFLKKLVMMYEIYPKVDTPINIEGKTYTPLLLISTLHNFKITKTLLSRSSKEMLKIYNLILKNAKIKMIDDYYKFGPEVGKGKFGKVNFGMSIEKNEKVAIKIIPKYNNLQPVSDDDYHIMKWEMDIFRFLSHSSHPNIVKCIEIFETSSYIYCVYEYLNHGTLKKYILTENNISSSEMLNMILQLIKAIQFLHIHGIIHRDLKHTNVMVNEDESSEKKNKKLTLKVIDFGLSKVIGKYELCNEPYGTLLFQAPEMLMGMMYNFKVDIWSLGIIVFFILFKETPFDDKNGECIKENILHSDLKIPQINELFFNNENYEVSFVCSLITECLEKNNRKRPDIFKIIRTYFKSGPHYGSAKCGLSNISSVEQTFSTTVSLTQVKIQKKLSRKVSRKKSRSKSKHSHSENGNN